MAAPLPAIVGLNIGGVRYDLALSTLRDSERARGSYFASLIVDADTWAPATRDGDGRVYIERNGGLAYPIIEYLRTGDWNPVGKYGQSLNERLLHHECDFYGVKPPPQLFVSDEALRVWRSQAVVISTDQLLATNGAVFHDILDRFATRAQSNVPMQVDLGPSRAVLAATVTDTAKLVLGKEGRIAALVNSVDSLVEGMMDQFIASEDYVGVPGSFSFEHWPSLVWEPTLSTADIISGLKEHFGVTTALLQSDDRDSSGQPEPRNDFNIVIELSLDGTRVVAQLERLRDGQPAVPRRPDANTFIDDEAVFFNVFSSLEWRGDAPTTPQ
jgi:BTB/POZ domain